MPVALRVDFYKQHNHDLADTLQLRKRDVPKALKRKLLEVSHPLVSPAVAAYCGGPFKCNACEPKYDTSV